MGRIILEIKDGEIVSMVPEGDTGIRFDDLISFCMRFMEVGCSEHVPKMTQAEKEDLYDGFSAIFDKFLERTFPGIEPAPPDLSDMALLYAQDLLVDSMNEKQITYDEALRKFEARAKEHVRQKRAGYSN